jgi:predicted glycoside hydrolase/deacetylase ChbG (UPF0249 family)
MELPPATVTLVVNADDFGLVPSISRGIIRAHEEGIVTSTSVVGNCEDVAGIKELLARAPRLGVGVHLTLTSGRPVSPPSSVRSLIQPDELFPTSGRHVLRAWLRRTLAAEEIEREFDAQVGRLRDLGLRIDHLDTHHHVGFVPPVGKAVEAVARRHRIPGLRSSIEAPSLAWVTEPERGMRAAVLSGLSFLTRRDLGALRHGPQSWGYVESGQLDEVRILEILGRLGPGFHELICHPGEEDDVPGPAGSAVYRRAGELAALTAPIVREALDRRGIQLRRWQDLF